MNNLGQEKTRDVFDSIPFLRSFPFDGYEIEIAVDGVDVADLGISPILIDALGTFGTEEHVKFYFNQDDSRTMISIHADDVLELEQIAKEVQSLNENFKLLDDALKSSDVRKKISNIKKSKKFIASLQLEALIYIQFDEIIPALAEIAEVEITDQLKSALVQLKAKEIISSINSIKEKKFIIEYLDFQLNYAMIILGIIIAAKIH